ncbi:MAG: hypothetical protein K940chlam6_00781 [Chlamydiae bacterium]|nr:hypothetical protein [Chlamydiota bacterium]
MTSNPKYSLLIGEALEDLSKQGIENLCPVLERMFNELMLIERGQVLQASLYERTDQRKGYANGFKNKMLQTRIFFFVDVFRYIFQKKLQNPLLR